VRRTRSSIAVSLDDGRYILVDATPDLKFQLEFVKLLPRPEEAEVGRQSRIDAVLLTHGHGDHCVGIAEFSTGKSYKIPVYAPSDLIRFLFGGPDDIKFFGELGRLAKDYVVPHTIEEGEELQLLECLKVTGFEIEHTERLKDNSCHPSSTFGYELKVDDSRFIYTPDLGILTEDLLKRVEGADLFILDATFWWNDELSRISGLKKTSYDLGHVPVEDSLEILRELDIDQIFYTHLNHTNPMLDWNLPMASKVRDAGIEIAHDGLVIEL
jgi:pyrroloquinoline quinone biosynthesis protein B